MNWKRTLPLWALAASCLMTPVQAEAGKTFYKKNFDYVRLEKAPKEIRQEGDLNHPIDIPVAKIKNMLASLHFDKRSILIGKLDNERLFDSRGIRLLAEPIAEALKEAGPNQVVEFRYIRKNPNAKVLRNDRLIRARCYIRGGEFFTRFTNVYSKIFGDYQRKGNNSDRFLRDATDRRISFEVMPGHRVISPKFVAMTIDHDYLTDLRAQAREEKSKKKKKKKKERQEIEGVPLPGQEDPDAMETEDDAPIASSTPSRTQRSTVKSKVYASDVERRLDTLKALRKKKLISEAEYIRKRREILKDL